MWNATCTNTRAPSHQPLPTTIEAEAKATPMESADPDHAYLGRTKPGRASQGRANYGHVRPEHCTICGVRKQSDKKGEKPWFLLTQKQGGNKLTIWKWNYQMAGRATAHSLCSPRHVRELVVHWMATGCLDYPFASGPPAVPDSNPNPASTTLAQGNATPSPHQLGEIAIERLAVERLLRENALALNVLLDELSDALGNARAESTAPDLCGAMRFPLRSM
jgi:hypothetical protein